MDRTDEIALARSAAPGMAFTERRRMILVRDGFETALKDKNGFVCLVERSWNSAAELDFLDPKVRVPICYNAVAAAFSATSRELN